MDITTISIVVLVASIALIASLTTALITKTLLTGSLQADLRYATYFLKMQYLHYTYRLRTR